MLYSEKSILYLYFPFRASASGDHESGLHELVAELPGELLPRDLLLRVTLFDVLLRCTVAGAAQDLPDGLVLGEDLIGV